MNSDLAYHGPALFHLRQRKWELVTGILYRRQQSSCVCPHQGFLQSRVIVLFIPWASPLPKERDPRTLQGAHQPCLIGYIP